MGAPDNLFYAEDSCCGSALSLVQFGTFLCFIFIIIYYHNTRTKESTNWYQGKLKLNYNIATEALKCPKARNICQQDDSMEMGWIAHLLRKDIGDSTKEAFFLDAIWGKRAG